MAQKTVTEVSLQLNQQHHLAYLKLMRTNSDNSHSSNGTHTIVYFKLAQLYSGKDTTMQTLRFTHRLDLRLVSVLGGRKQE